MHTDIGNCYSVLTTIVTSRPDYSPGNSGIQCDMGDNCQFVGGDTVTVDSAIDNMPMVRSQSAQNRILNELNIEMRLSVFQSYNFHRIIQ